ncbi:MAG: toll/interleukin-1 receptor domain-containing protein [Myxococcota bacterium]
MSGLVKLQLSDLFDGSADLIVLPCSTSGTITPMVAVRLVEYRIPGPPPMNLGDVSMLPFDGAENIAQYVAFATSVRGMGSDRREIRRIGEQLGQFTVSNESIRTISAPLLGAGAGGLSSKVVVDALAEGFRSCAERDAVLTIHVLHRSVYEKLSAEAVQPDANDRLRSAVPIRIFLSYSGTSERHKGWVAELGIFLRQQGINARLDQWHLRRGMDMPQWMSNELSMADRVVIVSDARYTERADGRMGGVGWETMLIQGEMSGLSPDSTKYLVIVRETEMDAGTPRYLKTKFAIHWPEGADDNSLRDVLITELYEVELEPPLASRPARYLV